jgi:hypothetical protein
MRPPAARKDRAARKSEGVDVPAGPRQSAEIQAAEVQSAEVRIVEVQIAEVRIVEIRAGADGYPAGTSAAPPRVYPVDPVYRVYSVDPVAAAGNGRERRDARKRVRWFRQLPVGLRPPCPTAGVDLSAALRADQAGRVFHPVFGRKCVRTFGPFD